MTKPMDPEIIAMRAIARALRTVDETTQVRMLDYFHAKAHATSQETVRRAMRLVGLEPANATSNRWVS